MTIINDKLTNFILASLAQLKQFIVTNRRKIKKTFLPRSVAKKTKKIMSGVYTHPKLKLRVNVDVKIGRYLYLPHNNLAGDRGCGRRPCLDQMAARWGASINDIHKSFRLFDPLPLVCIWSRFILQNSRNLP